ncbi:MAG: hypothetical protein WD398_04780 [Cyclobacteriaceae bacterium]
MKKQVSKMNDKELDDFLKKLSSSPEIPYVPQDWGKMEKILAKNKGAIHLNGYKWILLGSILMVGILFTTWLIATFSHFREEENRISTIISSSAKIGRGITPNNEINTHDLEFPLDELSGNHKAQTTEINAESLSQNHQYIPGPKAHQKVEKAQVPILVGITHPKRKIFEAFNHIGPIDKNFKIQNQALVQFNTQPSVNQHNKIAIGLLVSPDFSAIQYDQIPASGRNLGISLEYFLSERWSLASGVIHAQKTYRHGEGYWGGYSRAHQGLEGDCWILEVPLNIRYYPMQGKKDKWFVSSGLSSYFMMKEKYSLYYQNYNGNPYSREVEIKGNNQHVFGILNIGLGYERKVSEKFALQAEPYYRLPLVGIGEGNLNLKSAGIFFGIKYYL